MIWTNLKVFFRNVAGQRIFTAINVAGLSIGLASCLLIALYVTDEFSYDSQHPASDRTYRVSSWLVGIEQSGRIPISTSSPRVGELLQQNFPEVEAYTRMAEEPVYLSTDDTGDYEKAIRFADANFFTFFRFDWLQGDPATALAEPDSIVLTETLANKYFGAEEPLGRLLLLQRDRPLKVTGLIRDLQRTHLNGAAFVSMATLETLIGPEEVESWFSGRFHNYVRLQDGIGFASVRSVFHDFIERQMPPAAQALYDPDSLAVRDIHFAAPQAVGVSSNSKRQEALALLLVCIALLAIACINFINLATARSSQRGKEIAVRTVLGARRRQIFFQHIGECGLLVAFALLLGMGIAELSVPALNAFSGKDLNLMGTPGLLPSVLGVGLIVVLLSGAYPALYLAAFRPLATLKPVVQTRGPNAFVRNVLVILQFAIAIVLIVATTVIYQQVQYGKRIELGFATDQVLVIENEPGERWDVFKATVLARTAETQVSGAMNRPFNAGATSIATRYQGGDPQGENLSFLMVDFDYFELFAVDVLAGRTFSPAFASDRLVQPTAEVPHPGTALVLNRAMLEKLGWTAEEALGRTIELNWSPDFSASLMGEVVGVVENMRVDSLRREVAPLLYLVPSASAAFRYTFVNSSRAALSATLQAVDAIWAEVYPEQPINLYFLDTRFQILYRNEEKQASLLAAFAMLAISISCLGLYGLAAFTAERRSKEVGIRKVLGGSVWSIVRMLTTDFSKLVLLANLIAWPVAYMAMSRWLESFAYRVDLAPLIFIGSGSIALCIAWVTVGGTVARTASRKPVLALRYE